MCFLLGGDAALYREEARDPGQVRQGGAQHHAAGEWRPAARQPGPARRRAHVLAPRGPYCCSGQHRGPLATGGRQPGPTRGTPHVLAPRGPYYCSASQNYSPGALCHWRPFPVAEFTDPVLELKPALKLA
jgi:hypothetical protein